MMLPPTSGRKAVRLRNANIVTNISEIYAFLISTWIGTQTHRKKHSAAPPTWAQEFRIKLVALADQVQLLDQMTGLAKWEGSIRGKWPIQEYQSLVESESNMLGALAQVRFPCLFRWTSVDFSASRYCSLAVLSVTSRTVGGLHSCILQMFFILTSCVLLL